MDINRDALLLYLRDLRDLEMARYHIKNMIAREEANYQNTDSELQMTDFWEFRPEIEQKYSWNGSIGFCILAIIVGIILFAVSIPGIRLGSSSSDFVLFELIGGLILLFCLLLATVCVIVVIYCIVSIVKDISGEREYREKLEKTNATIRAQNQENENRVRQHNAEERVRQERNVQLRAENQQEWDKRKQFLEDEREKVKGILAKAYNENILATPYRNLQSVYYIYDYMSTSQASFEETLMHEHMENGFQRILARLDVIVENQAEEIFYLRRIEAQNDEIISRLGSMLDSLDRMERDNQNSFYQINATLGDIRDNTYQTSQYAGIAATYSAANAYFSLANYLKN
ncbi:MAG: hypothetical protein LUG17_03930 [Clostridiales bacterium]|nr:hypothetical protein [Clostridiales bacterium]